MTIKYKYNEKKGTLTIHRDSELLVKIENVKDYKDAEMKFMMWYAENHGF